MENEFLTLIIGLFIEHSTKIIFKIFSQKITKKLPHSEGRKTTVLEKKKNRKKKKANANSKR